MKPPISANTEPGNWLAHGRTYSEQRFSPCLRSTKTLSETGPGLELGYRDHQRS